MATTQIKKRKKKNRGGRKPIPTEQKVIQFCMYTRKSNITTLGIDEVRRVAGEAINAAVESKQKQ